MMVRTQIHWTFLGLGYLAINFRNKNSGAVVYINENWVKKKIEKKKKVE